MTEPDPLWTSKPQLSLNCISKQYGGTFGGPVKKGKAFFFVDYQGQHTVEGIETGLVTVPSLADRAGNLLDLVPTTLLGGTRATYFQSVTR